LYGLFVGLAILFCLIRFDVIMKNEHTCKPERVTYHSTTHVERDTIHQVDTLVIIESTKFYPCPTRKVSYISNWSLETQPYELFKNGKTRDTILRQVSECY
jgi:hypothetical protein